MEIKKYSFEEFNQLLKVIVTSVEALGHTLPLMGNFSQVILDDTDFSYDLTWGKDKKKYDPEKMYRQFLEDEADFVADIYLNYLDENHFKYINPFSPIDGSNLNVKKQIYYEITINRFGLKEGFKRKCFLENIYDLTKIIEFIGYNTIFSEGYFFNYIREHLDSHEEFDFITNEKIDYYHGKIENMTSTIINASPCISPYFLLKK